MNYNDPQKQTQLNKNAGKDLPGAAAWGGEDLLLSILNASLDIIQAFDAVRDDRGLLLISDGSCKTKEAGSKTEM